MKIERLTKWLIKRRKRLSFDRRWERRMGMLACVNTGLMMAQPFGLSDWGKRRKVRLEQDFIRMANLRKSQVNTAGRKPGHLVLSPDNELSFQEGPFTETER